MSLVYTNIDIKKTTEILNSTQKLIPNSTQKKRLVLIYGSREADRETFARFSVSVVMGGGGGVEGVDIISLVSC